MFRGETFNFHEVSTLLPAYAVLVIVAHLRCDSHETHFLLFLVLLGRLPSLPLLVCLVDVKYNLSLNLDDAYSLRFATILKLNLNNLHPNFSFAIDRLNTPATSSSMVDSTEESIKLHCQAGQTRNCVRVRHATYIHSP